MTDPILPSSVHPKRFVTSPRLWLFLLLALALGLRLLNIGATSLWIDEIYSLMVANVHPVPPRLLPEIQTAADFYRQYLAWQPMKISALIDLLKINVHMPLYYLLLNPWLSWAGHDAIGLRGFSAVCSVLLLLPVYALGKAFGGKRAGLLAVFVGAVLPYQLYYAQEGRMYALSLLLSTGSALAFWKTLYDPKPLRWGLLHALFTTLAVLSHYMVVFFLAFQGLYALLWLLRTRDFKRLAYFGLTVVGLAAVAIGWAPIYQIQQQGINDEYHFAKGWSGWLRYATAIVWQPLVMVAGDNRLERLFYLPVTILLLLSYGAGQLRGKATENRFSFQREGFLLCWLFVPLLVQVGYDFLKQTHTSVIDRYVLLISPAMILLLALALEQLFQNGRRKIAYALTALMLVMGIANVWWPSPFRDEHNKKDVRGKIAYMLRQAQPDDLIFVNGPLGAPNLAAYYLNQSRPTQPMLYWISRYREQDVKLPPPELFRPYRRVWLFRNRANNERGLQQAKEYLQSMFPRTLETEEKNDWFLYSRQ